MSSEKNPINVELSLLICLVYLINFERRCIIVKTKFWTLQPKGQRWQKAVITTSLIIFMGGGLLFGAINMIEATQINKSVCDNHRSISECPPGGQTPFFQCPDLNRIGTGCIPREKKPICPSLPNFNTTCPLDAAE